jgi:hypothetical protein
MQNASTVRSSGFHNRRYRALNRRDSAWHHSVALGLRPRAAALEACAVAVDLGGEHRDVRVAVLELGFFVVASRREAQGFGCEGLGLCIVLVCVTIVPPVHCPSPRLGPARRKGNAFTPYWRVPVSDRNAADRVADAAARVLVQEGVALHVVEEEPGCVLCAVDGFREGPAAALEVPPGGLELPAVRGGAVRDDDHAVLPLDLICPYSNYRPAVTRLGYLIPSAAVP